MTTSAPFVYSTMVNDANRSPVERFRDGKDHMVGLALNIIVGLVLVCWGSLIFNRHPSTSGFMDWIQARANAFAGGDYCVPFYVVALLFILLGGFALFNAFMIIAERYGFWIV